MSIKQLSQQSKKRKYYKPHTEKVSKNQRLFLVKYFDLKKDSCLCDGPFNQQEEALETVSEYLRKGICSWMVTYND